MLTDETEPEPEPEPNSDPEPELQLQPTPTPSTSAVIKTQSTNIQPPRKRLIKKIQPVSSEILRRKYYVQKIKNEKMQTIINNLQIKKLKLEIKKLQS